MVLRDAPALRSLNEIQSRLTEDIIEGVFPRGLIPHVTHLLCNMKVRGIGWANIQYDALYITSETPDEVAKAILKKFDEANAFRPTAPISRGRGGRGGRGRGRGGGKEYQPLGER